METQEIPDGPPGYEYFLDGTFYKIGRFNAAKRWGNGDWYKSSKTKAELDKAAMPKEDRPDKILNIDIVLKTVIENGDLTKNEIIEISESKESTCSESLRCLVRSHDLELTDGLYSAVYPKKLNILAGVSL